MEMPSQEEQKIAEDYVLNKPMDRPDTDAKKAALCCGIYLLASAALGMGLMLLFQWLGVFSYFPNGFNTFRESHPVWFNVLYFLLIYFITGICCGRMAAIGCIKLYQHYAPEEVRRRCLFKPTCSEYAILAIKKYGLIRGGYKTYVRLFHKCWGDVYSIDYP